MTDRIEAACANELEILLEAMFASQPMTPTSFPGVSYGHDPVIGRVFIAGEDHSAHRLAICGALVADIRFRRETGMSLPLRREQIEAFVDDDNPRLNVIGLYGGSQRGESWCADHPSFAEFVSGVLAHEQVPLAIWQDHSLRREFTPRRLKGLCDDGLHLHWRSPKTTAMLRANDRIYEAACTARRAAEAHNSV